METNMMENGKTVRDDDIEFMLDPMEENMNENGKMVREKDSER
jgi:hypothetical protein